MKQTTQRQCWGLWPGLPPDALDELPRERIEERVERGLVNRVVLGVREPHIALVRPPKPNGAILLLIPGGAYIEQWFEKEGFEIARHFASAGVTSFVLRYRLPQEGWAKPAAVPLQDAQRAVRLIRARAPAMGLDPARLCAMGFSAGGYLVARLSTAGSAAYAPVDAVDEGSIRPSLAALIYPAIDMQLFAEFIARTTLPNGLLAETPSPNDLIALTPSRFVDSATPPSFLIHAFDDPVVPADHSLGYATALRTHNVPTELHLFEEGGHGFALRQPPGASAAAWPALFLAWAARHGF